MTLLKHILVVLAMYLFLLSAAVCVAVGLVGAQDLLQGISQHACPSTVDTTGH